MRKAYQLLTAMLVAVMCVFCSNCGGATPKAEAQVIPGTVTCDKGCGVSLDSHTATMITESFNGASQTAAYNFPLAKPIIVDSVSGTIAYKGHSNACAGQEIAMVGFVEGLNSATGEAQKLVAYDLYTYGDKPVNIPVNQTFPGGIKIDSLRETVFDDQCHMTNFRLALVFHYQ